jgi:hypothetical protein
MASAPKKDEDGVEISEEVSGRLGGHTRSAGRDLT